VRGSRSLERLFRIRELEEDQSRLALDAALAELRRLEAARAHATEQGRRGRQIVGQGVREGSLGDRIAGLEQAASAERRTAALDLWIRELEGKTEMLREAHRRKSLERRQAETLVDEAEARDALDALRRGQAALDEWYGNRMHARNHQARNHKPQKHQEGPVTGLQSIAGTQTVEDKRETHQDESRAGFKSFPDQDQDSRT
jgi:hypothetical protein